MLTAKLTDIGHPCLFLLECLPSRVGMAMIYVVFFHSSFVTSLSQRSLSAASSSLCLLLLSPNLLLYFPCVSYRNLRRSGLLFFHPPSGHLTSLNHFNLLLTNFVLKVSSLQPPPLGSLSLPLRALLTPAMLLIQLLSQTCTFCCVSVNAIVFRSYVYAG